MHMGGQTLTENEFFMTIKIDVASSTMSPKPFLIKMNGWLEIGKFVQKQSVSIFSSNCACAAFNWVL